MSRMLSLALYCEGSTDERFLPLLIQRTVQDILHRKSSGFVTVMPVDVIKTQASKQAQCILQAAIQACDYHILFIHADADDATPDKALSQRYNPGYELVQQCSQKICKNLLPIVPVYMTEAWMLADHETLRELLKTELTVHELQLPVRAKLVERDAHPKETLKFALQKVYAGRSRRRRHVDVSILYEPLGRMIRLERLNEVPAYRQFVEHLIGALITLRLVA